MARIFREGGLYMTTLELKNNRLRKYSMSFVLVQYVLFGSRKNLASNFAQFFSKLDLPGLLAKLNKLLSKISPDSKSFMNYPG
jgi:hypothetical protein